MKRSGVTIVAALLLLVTGFASAKAQPTVVPRFEDYRAPVYKGRIAPVNLKSAAGAGSFRTRLREGSKQGVNFAGHYTLVSWGCGAGCLSVAIIDAKNGAVFFPKELSAFGVWYWEGHDEPLTVKPNSRLLIMSGFPSSETESDDPKSGWYYYEWTGTKLKLIKFDQKFRYIS